MLGGVCAVPPLRRRRARMGQPRRENDLSRRPYGAAVIFMHRTQDSVRSRELVLGYCRAAPPGPAFGMTELRVGFVLSHPCAKSAQGWGTLCSC